MASDEPLSASAGVSITVGSLSSNETEKTPNSVVRMRFEVWHRCVSRLTLTRYKKSPTLEPSTALTKIPSDNNLLQHSSQTINSGKETTDSSLETDHAEERRQRR